MPSSAKRVLKFAYSCSGAPGGLCEACFDQPRRVLPDAMPAAVRILPLQQQLHNAAVDPALDFPVYLVGQRLGGKIQIVGHISGAPQGSLASYAVKSPRRCMISVGVRPHSWTTPS